jgi:YkoY family integral membrane protein
MDQLLQQLHHIFGPDLQASLFIVLNLVVIESLLSVDNAAVLATMVLDLPEKDRGRALKFGIFGAYIFRGLCLLFASFLIRIWWLKPLGGLYLIYLAFNYFRQKSEGPQEGELLDKDNHWLYKLTIGKLGLFWATVSLVEIMDLAFSIDNVFAAVAFTENLYLIWIGVFIGILAMRFVAQAFVTLIEKFPFLETVAFLVIGILGVKLTLSIIVHFMPTSMVGIYLESEQADYIVSIVTILLFGLPILTSAAFNFPRKQKLE